MNYYNDNDPKSSAWLKELIYDGLIPMGEVDERSILDVTGSDLKGYTQCHFFAGIGGWSEALRLSGWPADRPVWTGSCPCQPFSCAGKRAGEKDERHLWPEFRRLIAECNPSVVFGEQVASKDGRLWLSGVRSDLEGMAYAVGAADLCAAGVGAPHIRQRLYWVADAENTKRRRMYDGKEYQSYTQIGGRGNVGRLADADGGNQRDGDLQRVREHGQQQENGCSCIGMEHTESDRRGPRRAESDGRGVASGCGEGCGMGDSECGRSKTYKIRPGESELERSSAGLGFWSNSIWIPCADGKARRIEPSIFPLAHGVSGRVGLLRGAGNAINPYQAAEFIMAYMEVL